MTSRPDISLDVNNLFSGILPSGGISREALENLKAELTEIHQGLSDLRRLGQMPYQDLPHQDENLGKILDDALGIRKNFSSVLVLGIGGSALGGRLLVESLGVRSEGPSVIFCDSVDASEWHRLAAAQDWTRTLLIVISKSGKTVETLAAFRFFSKILKSHVGERFSHHVRIITDPQKGSLRPYAVSEGIPVYDISPGVGGRYAVLSAVGLLPAACAGVDVRSLLDGAKRMDERTHQSDVWFNPPMMSAALQYLLSTEKERTIRVIMTYGERLKHFAPWFVQLWSESLGKKSFEGAYVRSTPLPASGPQDQHAQFQLYLDGPPDKTVTFVSCEEDLQDVYLGEPSEPELASLPNRSIHQLLTIERLATEEALRVSGVPNQTLLLKRNDAYSLGQLLYFSEMETVYAGELFDVNPFDQPAVERIKNNIQELLSGKILGHKKKDYIL